MIMLAVRFSVSTAAIVVDGCGPIAAIGRSWNLTRGNYWRVLGFWIAFALLVYALQIVPLLLAALPPLLIPYPKVAASLYLV